jgi:predicted choloylglycine hydrolase
VFLNPDRRPVITTDRATTNHQGRVDWPTHARWTRSVERLETLTDALEAPGCDHVELAAAMVRPPLRADAFEEGFATLYTAVYDAAQRSVEYRWPSSALRQSFADFREGMHEAVIEPAHEPDRMAA